MPRVTLGLLAAFLSVLTAAGGCSMQRAPQDPQKASIAQFIKMRWPSNGHLAPNGKFYYVHLYKDVSQLFRRAPGDKKDAVLTHFKDGIGGYRVSEDGRWIAITAAEGGNEQYDIYLMDAATEKIEALLVDPDTVFSSIVWKRDGSGFAYRANKESKADFYVYYYDLAERQSHLVSDRPGTWFPVDFKTDGSRLLVGHYISSSESYLWEISLIGEGARPLSPLDERWVFGGAGYGPKDDTVYVITDQGCDRRRLARVTLTSGVIEPVLPQFNRFEVDYAELNRERSVMAVGLNVDGLTELHLFSIPDLQPLPLPDLPPGTIGNVAFQGDLLMFALNNAKNPGVIYTWPLGQLGTAPTALTEAETQGIDVGRFVMPELVRYKSFDGLEIPAFMYLPVGFHKGAPIPFILYYHGGPEGQYRPSFSKLFQYFVSRGYGVLAPNVRGSSGYGTGFLKLDDYKKRMDSVKDGVAAAQWLVDQGYSAPRLIAAHGGSYGGFMVVAAISQAPELFGAACDVVGIVNFDSFLKRTKDYRRELREAEYGPLSDTEFLQSISPIHMVDRIDTPVLIVHGKNDPRVPLFEAQQLHDALRERGKPVEMMVFDDEGHGLRKESNQIEFYARLVDYFDEHLKPRT